MTPQPHRVTVCLNACEGLPTEAIEWLSIKNLIALLAEQVPQENLSLAVRLVLARLLGRPMP